MSPSPSPELAEIVKRQLWPQKSPKNAQHEINNDYDLQLFVAGEKLKMIF